MKQTSFILAFILSFLPLFTFSDSDFQNTHFVASSKHQSAAKAQQEALLKLQQFIRWDSIQRNLPTEPQVHPSLLDAVEFKSSKMGSKNQTLAVLPKKSFHKFIFKKLRFYDSFTQSQLAITRKEEDAFLSAQAFYKASKAQEKRENLFSIAQELYPEKKLIASEVSANTLEKNYIDALSKISFNIKTNSPDTVLTESVKQWSKKHQLRLNKKDPTHLLTLQFQEGTCQLSVSLNNTSSHVLGKKIYDKKFCPGGVVSIFDQVKDQLMTHLLEYQRPIAASDKSQYAS